MSEEFENETHVIQTDIIKIEKNISLYEENNFYGRYDAIDFIEFNIIDRIEGLLQKSDHGEQLHALKIRAELCKSNLEETDRKFYHGIREEIRNSNRPSQCLKNVMNSYLPNYSNCMLNKNAIGYDCLDSLINGILHQISIPSETKIRDPGMVYFQKTPVRIILELIDRAHFTSEDIFYDVGSGLGQVAMLVNLLSGIRAKGIEFDPAYCSYARTCAVELNLSNVEFIVGDAREADYSKGTIYFMYTPLEGDMLEEVLMKMEKQFRKGTRLFTYGPCTLEVLKKSWLQCIENGQKKENCESNIHKLAMLTVK